MLDPSSDMRVRRGSEIGVISGTPGVSRFKQSDQRENVFAGHAVEPEGRLPHPDNTFVLQQCRDQVPSEIAALGDLCPDSLRESPAPRLRIARACLHRSLAKSKLGRHDEAIAELDQAIRRDPRVLFRTGNQ